MDKAKAEAIEAQYIRTVANDKYNADGLEKTFQNSSTNMKRAINTIKISEKTWWQSYKRDFGKAFSLHIGSNVNKVAYVNT